MTTITKKQKTKYLPELISINKELIMRGYQLTMEDIKELLQTQKKACQLYHMVDFTSTMLFQFAQLFQYSPYINDHRFLTTLHQAIYVYYDLQSRLTHSLYDLEVCSAIYDGYLRSNGDFSICRNHVFSMLKKQEELYAGNNTEQSYE